ncbi:hypothetical protein BJV78DRAFT_1165592 [Lactifluus subvellereus]|nr:hypothetical protein BJV78DRAFT_1165592 [Lactifluus subvellereus]
MFRHEILIYTFTQTDSRSDFDPPPWRRSYPQRRRYLHHSCRHNEGKRAGLRDRHRGR